MGKKRVPDLYRAPFPLYSIKVDPNTGLVITAGGGGASKTGIKNAVVSTEHMSQCQKHAYKKLITALYMEILCFAAIPGSTAGWRTPVQC